ncbi:branched-chain amino acid transport system II carrier protein [Enterococcus sp. HY326]|uniref:branched-chain amino acid transport system II carrier protein n=1 Tax=Enterococcus sp. HY326 TaxID=2971265 RepID=UPI00223F3296|nr:branched-chain amino acid transport system II carrier protein [Enterococcus sp. HY326]
MEHKLSFREKLFIGSMLFGLFFGAGNLIFPIHLGQEAGANVFSANLGFLVTGIGLPFLGIIALAISGSGNVYDLASKVNQRYAKIFTVLLYLVIGPFFALPRLATTSFEIGIAPFINAQQQPLVLALFSVIFFLIAWGFARKPTKILVYVGKFLNPIFLILLGFLLLLAFVNPLGSITDAAVQGSYQSEAFSTGFTQGYNTLDALAALAFGIVIISTVKNLGVKKEATIAKYTIQSGAISIILMGVIYTLLAYLGTMSLGSFAVSENGGIALAQVANYYLGGLGSFILALIVITACLKTAIGLITSFSETFADLFPKRSYNFYILVVSFLPCLFANVGLTKIIEFSTPVLMFLYPLAIVLILLPLLEPLIGYRRLVYQMTTYFTLFAAIIDGLNAAPAWISNWSIIESIINFGSNYLPFFNIGMGWIIPAVVGFIISFILDLNFNKRIKKT